MADDAPTGPTSAETQPTAQVVKNETIYDELRFARERQETTDSYREKVTQPESKRYEPEEEFAFMVHCPLDVDSRTEELGTDEFEMQEKPLNTSVVDTSHTWTFEGMSGLIIEPPVDEADVLGTWSYDSGLNDLEADSELTDVDTLLEKTGTDSYNQVNVRKGRVVGVFIRIKEDGQPIDGETRAIKLREFAQKNGLPVAEIVIKPVNHPDQKPEMISPTDDLTTVEFSIGGSKYRLEELLADPQRPLPGAEPFEGYYLRARKIDGYGAAGGDVRDKETLSLILQQISSIDRASLDDRQSKALDVHINFIQSLLNS